MEDLHPTPKYVLVHLYPDQFTSGDRVMLDEENVLVLKRLISAPDARWLIDTEPDTPETIVWFYVDERYPTLIPEGDERAIPF